MRSAFFKAAALAALALFAGARLVEWDRLDVNGLNRTLNDQVGYISVARHLAAEGRLESSVVYPSTLAQKTRTNALYLPGHYLALAAALRLAGDSVAASFLPSLCGYALSALLVFFVAAGLYGPEAGVLACALFAFFPLNLIFAFTAMGEMDLTAAVLSAFALFLLLPEGRRARWGPALLVLPLVFRESAAALAAVMGAMVLLGAGGGRRRAAEFAGLACAVVVLFLASPAGNGRPSLWGANILFHGSSSAAYADAFALARARPDAAAWAAAVAGNLRGNLRDLVRLPSPLEWSGLFFLWSGVPLGIWSWRRERDAFAAGVAGMALLLAVLDLGLYSVWTFRGVRALLICQPFVAILWARAASRAAARRRLPPSVPGLAVAALAAGGLAVALVPFRLEKRVNDLTARDTAFVASVADGRPGLLVAPWWLATDYVHARPGTRWSFIPANPETWELLNRRYPIGTVILPERDADAPSDAGAARLGLAADGVRIYRGTAFRIYRGPAAGRVPPK